MDFRDRLIALTDVETTGLDASVYEIIEVGLVVFDQRTFEIKNTLDIKVMPQHPEVFSPMAMEINGYTKKAWKKSFPLDYVMRLYSEKTVDAMFCSHNVTFDWSFIEAAFKKTEVVNYMDYHRIDLLTLAWSKLRNTGLERLKMAAVALHLGIPEEPQPHRAFTGVMTEYEIFFQR
ncbi:MAG: polymerase III epsilon subunit protein [candidate division WWE3 bacterium GW2011_GWD1_42_70]|nr:MAG: polymerase III epsilon subunit protein [candidate division WWE3 bacterium GW2011_GWD1_42_70]